MNCAAIVHYGFTILTSLFIMLSTHTMSCKLHLHYTRNIMRHISSQYDINLCFSKNAEQQSTCITFPVISPFLYVLVDRTAQHKSPFSLVEKRKWYQRMTAENRLHLSPWNSSMQGTNPARRAEREILAVARPPPDASKWYRHHGEPGALSTKHRPCSCLLAKN